MRSTEDEAGSDCPEKNIWVRISAKNWRVPCTAQIRTANHCQFANLIHKNFLLMPPVQPPAHNERLDP